MVTDFTKDGKTNTRAKSDLMKCPVTLLQAELKPTNHWCENLERAVVTQMFLPGVMQAFQE